MQDKHMINDYDEEQKLIATTRQLLDARNEQLSAAVLSQLAAARTNAINSKRSRERVTTPWLIPAAGFASVAAIAVMVTVLWNAAPDSLNTQSAPFFEDMQLLSASEDLEMLQELDFYEWLAYEKEVG